MIIKRVRIFKRLARDWDKYSSDKHVEKVVRESWWLLGIIPLYVHESVVSNNL